MFCQKCGTEFPETSEFCHKCGAKIDEEAAFNNDYGTKEVYEDAIQQPIDTTDSIVGSQQATGAVEPAVVENIQCPPYASTAEAKEDATLRKVAVIGRVLIGVSLVLLFLMSFFKLPLPIKVVFVAGAAVGIILSVIGAKRPLSLNKIIELIVAVVLVGAVAVYALSFGGIEDKYVRTVKNGTFKQYPQKTIGEAFDGFLSNPKWKSSLSEGNERFVTVKGKMLFLDEKVELTVQFLIEKDDNKNFSYSSCEIDGVPQGNLIFKALLEKIYEEHPKTLKSSDKETAEKSLDRIAIGQTKSSDNYFGNMEVTLDYVEFLDKLKNQGYSSYSIPDEGEVYLRAVITIKNIGTAEGSVSSSNSTLIFDNEYEYSPTSTDGTFSLKPLSQPTTSSIVFAVPKEVMESDRPLAIHFDDNDSYELYFEIRENTSSVAQSQSVPNTPVYDVDELALRLGTRQGSLYEEGAPLYGKYDQCEKINADDKYGLKYGDLTVLGSRALDGDIVEFSTTNPKTFQKNGISLDKSETDLTAIFGEAEFGGQEQGVYYLTFLCDGYSLSAKFNDPAKAPYEIIIHY